MRSFAGLALIAFAFGCSKPPDEPAPPPTAPKDTAVQPPVAPAVPDSLKLPLAGAKPLPRTEAPLVYLNVNTDGHVLPPPQDQFKDAGGKTVTKLDTEGQVTRYLSHFTDEEYRAAGVRPPRTRTPDDIKDNEPPLPTLKTVVALRIDANAPYGKVHPILRGIEVSGIRRVQWRTSTPDGAEGGVAGTLTFEGDHLVLKENDRFATSTLRVQADAAGKVAKLVLGGVDLQSDVSAVTKRLKNLKAKHKDKDLALKLEMGEKLLYSEVIRLIDEAAAAEMTTVMPILIDPNRR